jgi:hypothetical protein
MNEQEERREEEEEEEEEARGRGEKTEEEKVEEAAKVAEALLGFTTCAFCGAEFRKDVDGAKITGHIYNCAKHPVGKMLLELESARDYIGKYDKAATEARNALRDAGVPEIEEKGNHRRALTIADRIKILAEWLDAKRPGIPKREGP